MSNHVGTSAKVAAAICLIFAASLRGQGQQPAKEARVASALRQSAVTLLDSTIDELDGVEDMEARLTFSQEIVKLLAGSRPERCRQMLDSLFDELIKSKSEVAAQDKSQRTNPDLLLRKLIQAAASFDRKLAQTYIDRYTGQTSGRKGEQATTARQTPMQADLNMMLALQLAETDPGLAVRVAERAVSVTVTPRALEFLGTLRKRNPAAADAFFVTSLESVRARQAADINELFLLHSYVFSPTRVLGLTPQGLVMLQIPGYMRVTQDYPVTPAMAQRFLQVSSQILLTDIQYRQGTLGPTYGAAGDLYFINLIKPLAVRYAPGLLGPLSEQGNLLVSYLQPEQNSRLQSDVEHVSALQSSNREGAGKEASTFESLLGRADGLPQSPKRDYLYYMAAVAAVRERKYDAAAAAVERMSESARAVVKGFIDFSIAQQSIGDQQFEMAESWAQRDTDLGRRAYILTFMANSLLEGGKDYSRATKFLADAEQLTSKLDSTHEEFSILLREAEIYSSFDTLRASEVLRQAFRATAKNKEFTGEGRVNRSIAIGDFSIFYELFNDRESLSRAVSRLAPKDFYGTLSAIRELQNPSLRLRALISLCGGILATSPI
jgi:hypothetical protein